MPYAQTSVSLVCSADFVLEAAASKLTFRSSIAIHRVEPFTLVVLVLTVMVAVMRREIPKSESRGVPKAEMRTFS